jgi:phage terminase large subunit-like protein
LDLSATSDLTAWVLWFPPDDWEEGEHILLCRFWIPEAEMDLKIRRDHVPYDIWKKQGYIQTTPGETIDYRYVFRQTEEDFQKFDIQDCNFDRWGSEKIRQDITELVGKDEFMIQFGQGDASMNAPTVEILRLVKNLKVNHGGNPVLRWHADSLTVKQGPTGLIKPVKPDRMKQANRVDGMVAAIMALDRAMRNKPKNPDDTVMEVW